MTDYTAWHPTNHPEVDEVDYNQILDHGFEKTASYVIRKNGGTYEALDGSTGKIVSSSTDAATVFNVVSALGGLITVKCELAITSTINIPTGTYVKGLGQMGNGKISCASDINMITLSAQYSGLRDIQISNSHATYTHNAIVVDDSSSQIFSLDLQNIFIYKNSVAPTAGGNAILIQSTDPAHGITHNYFCNIKVVGNFYSTLYFSTVTGGWITGNTFRSFASYNTEVTTDMDNAADASDNIIEDFDTQYGASSVKGIKLNGYRNILLTARVFDFPDANRGLEIAVTAVDTKVKGCTWSGLLSDSGTRTRYDDDCLQILTGGNKYAVFSGTGLGLGDPNITEVAHSLFKTPTTFMLCNGQNNPTNAYFPGAGCDVTNLWVIADLNKQFRLYAHV